MPMISALELHKWRMELEFLRQRVDAMSEQVNARDAERKELEKHQIRASEIIELSAAMFGLKPEDICRKNAEARVAIARQTAQYLIREIMELNLRKVADLTGMKDHSTVLHSVRKIQRLRETDGNFDMKLRRLENKLMDGGQWDDADDDTGKREPESIRPVAGNAEASR